MVNPYTKLARQALAEVHSIYVAKGQKPLGAAFSHGRAKAKELGQDAHEDVVRHANAYLRSKGHSEIKKGLLSRYRALTIDERADMGVLQELGFSKDEARALALAGTSGAVRKSAKLSYHEAYVEEAKRSLPAAMHKNLHTIARARAGGFARAQTTTDAAQSADAAQSQMDVARAWARNAAASPDKVPGSDARLMKAGPSLGEVENFGAPGGSKLKFQVKIAADGGYQPPKAVQNACERGLDLAPKYGGAGLTDGAKSRARSMAQGKSISLATAKRMVSFFARHASYEKQASPPSPGYVAWQLWGGDAGRRWANGIVRRVDKFTTPTAITKREGAPRGDWVETLMCRERRTSNALADAMLAAVRKADASAVEPQVSEDATYQRLFQAQDLVSRMDNALASDPELSVEDARARASDSLARRRNMEGKPQDASPFAGHDKGLRLDVDAGDGRERGFLSLDTYPYDHGTILHDVGMGLPVPSASAAAIRTVGAVWDRPRLKADPAPLLAEIQRALRMGGVWSYEGPKLSDDKLAQLPGIAVQHREDLPGDNERLVGKRVQAKLPTVYGADPSLMNAREETPGDIAAARAAYGLTPPPASVAMANLLTKSQSAVETLSSLVFKKDAWQQIVYGAVLVPDEEDSQGDKISADEIQKTAHRFLETRMVGQEHLGPMEGATVVESYIAPQDMVFAGAPDGAQVIPQGSWVLGVHIADPELWEKVLADEFTGFSVGGFGDRIPRND